MSLNAILAAGRAAREHYVKALAADVWALVTRNAMQGQELTYVSEDWYRRHHRGFSIRIHHLDVMNEVRKMAEANYTNLYVAEHEEFGKLFYVQIQR
jgi:hypothetical protein